MIILFIVIAILYLFMIYGVISLYYTYNKDYNDLEYRILDLEKRINKCEQIKETYQYTLDLLFENLEVLNIDTYNKLKEYNKIKEGDTMACKKGRGGRKK